jgi:hypothetical protein
MKYALVCKNESREQGYRVADIADAIPFEPAPDHMWIECNDDLLADAKWFDPADNSFKDFPIQKETLAAPHNNQPTSTGTKTI